MKDPQALGREACTRIEATQAQKSVLRYGFDYTKASEGDPLRDDL
jgi:hypothetical protein